MRKYKYVTYLSQRDPLTSDHKYCIRLSGSLTRLISATLNSNAHLSPVPNIHLRMDQRRVQTRSKPQRLVWKSLKWGKSLEQDAVKLKVQREVRQVMSTMKKYTSKLI